jgi:hypothetical protein
LVAQVAELAVEVAIQQQGTVALAAREVLALAAVEDRVVTWELAALRVTARVRDQQLALLELLMALAAEAVAEAHRLLGLAEQALAVSST